MTTRANITLPMVADQISPEQAAKVEDLAKRFGCWPDDYDIIIAPFELPPNWIEVIIGKAKGRPILAGINPEGEAST